MYSDALHIARSSACRVLETCRGSTVVMLLMYRRKSVGEMTPPCGTPSRIFTLLLKWPSSFILADLSCRKHRIHLYILPEPLLSSIFSRRPSRQTLSKAFVRSKKTENLFLFLKGILYLLGNEGKLIFCASVFPISSLCLLQYFPFFQKWYQSSVDYSF